MQAQFCCKMIVRIDSTCAIICMSLGGSGLQEFSSDYIYIPRSYLDRSNAPHRKVFAVLVNSFHDSHSFPTVTPFDISRPTGSPFLYLSVYDTCLCSAKFSSTSLYISYLQRGVSTLSTCQCHFSIGCKTYAFISSIVSFCFSSATLYPLNLVLLENPGPFC